MTSFCALSANKRVSGADFAVVLECCGAARVGVVEVAVGGRLEELLLWGALVLGGRRGRKWGEEVRSTCVDIGL
jgi:hypothetical protein